MALIVGGGGYRGMPTTAVAPMAMPLGRCPTTALACPVPGPCPAVVAPVALVGPDLKVLSPPPTTVMAAPPPRPYVNPRMGGFPAPGVQIPRYYDKSSKFYKDFGEHVDPVILPPTATPWTPAWPCMPAPSSIPGAAPAAKAEKPKDEKPKEEKPKDKPKEKADEDKHKDEKPKDDKHKEEKPKEKEGGEKAEKHKDEEHAKKK